MATHPEAVAGATAVEAVVVEEDRLLTDMRLLLVQSSPVWEDPMASLRELDRMLSDSVEADLIVLPEMFSTGFVTEPEGIAERDGGNSLQWMRELAASRSCAVAGSLSVMSGSSYRNRFYFVFPDGSEIHYDKRHLFSYSGEGLGYTPGQERVIVSYNGVRILPQVCYDLRFPVFSRNRILGGAPEYDLILYVASWPEKRIGAWDALLKARAIENACYVAGVNRVGSDPSNYYPGHTTFISPQGEVLSVCKQNETDSLICEVSVEELELFRRSFPVLDDAD